ncbi:hypothetical protein BDQ17DRAFT_1541516 [Cyathus striatus]|nr:hypothetical protein BDQ17DRAFT_1541516 [Cyathus striatus]
MSDKTVPASQEIIALFLAATLYGLYLSTFLHCIRWLLFVDQGWKLRRLSAVKWPTLIATLLIFAFSFIAVFLAILEDVNEVRELEKTSTIVQARASDTDSARPTVSGIIVCTTANLSDLIADWILVYRVGSYMKITSRGDISYLSMAGRSGVYNPSSICANYGT